MALNRRDYLKIQGMGLLSALMGMVGVAKAKSPFPPLFPMDSSSSESEQGDMHIKERNPVVLSTWDYGMKTNAEAWKVLQANGTALDAVIAGAELAELDPDNQYVGLGGFPDRDGKVTLDASVMDHRYNMGSVAGLENMPRASALARMVMEHTPHTMLVGDGALQYAIEQGFETMNLLTPASEAAWRQWLETSHYVPGVNLENSRNPSRSMPLVSPDNHDTMGLVAIDEEGRLAGVCTTSGMAYKMHGRVGDTPLMGSGLYVDPQVGAVTATGHGEEIVRAGGSLMVIEGMRQGLSPQEACQKVALRVLMQLRYRDKDPQMFQACFLALDTDGNSGACSLQPGFTYAIQDAATGNRLLQAPYVWSKP